MEFTEAQLQEFIELYRKECDIELSPVEAHAKALSLIHFICPDGIPIFQENDILSMPDSSF